MSSSCRIATFHDGCPLLSAGVYRIPLRPTRFRRRLSTERLKMAASWDVSPETLNSSKLWRTPE